MSETVSIMPLVEENRALHDRVRVLEDQLASMNVRMDEFLSEQRAPVQWVDARMNRFDLLADAHGARRNMAEALVQAMLGRIDTLAMKVEMPSLSDLADSDVRFRFAFVALNRSR